MRPDSHCGAYRDGGGVTPCNRPARWVITTNQTGRVSIMFSRCDDHSAGLKASLAAAGARATEVRYA